MNRPAKIQRAKALRDQGCTYKQIGEGLGVSLSTAHNWVKQGPPSEKSCAGCGTDLTGSHGKTKWCSERCCRRTRYTNTCACGAEIYDGSASPPTICGECKHEARYGERNARLREMWEAAEPTWHIAETLGMSESAVTAWVDSRRRRHGEPLSLRRARNRDHWPEIEKLWSQGLTAREIGERIGLTAWGVGARVQCMRAAGIDLPRRSKFPEQVQAGGGVAG